MASFQVVWRRVYGAAALLARGLLGRRAQPAAVVAQADAVVELAQKLGGFAGFARHEEEFQRRFEVLALCASAALVGLPAGARGALVEELINRLAVGLLEGRHVGDMKLGPKVRTYAQALHGRVQRYGPLLAAHDWPGLATAAAAHGVAPAVLHALKKELAAAGKVG